jgi:hypothetical protein
MTSDALAFRILCDLEPRLQALAAWLGEHADEPARYEIAKRQADSLVGRHRLDDGPEILRSSAAWHVTLRELELLALPELAGRATPETQAHDC